MEPNNRQKLNWNKNETQPREDTFCLQKGLSVTQGFVKAPREAGTSHSFNSSFLLLPGLGLRNPMASCKGHSSLRNRVDLGQMQTSDSSYSLTLSLDDKGKRWEQAWQHHEVLPLSTVGVSLRKDLQYAEDTHVFEKTMQPLMVIASCYLGEGNWAVVKLENWGDGILALQQIIPGFCGAHLILPPIVGRLTHLGMNR